jgi:hypothetical protein
MTTDTTARAGLDNRVTDEEGRPVPERRIIRGWFRISRAAGPSGVILHAVIPGYMDQASPHPTQSAAVRAVRRIYAGYRDAVSALSDRSEHQED